MGDPENPDPPEPDPDAPPDEPPPDDPPPEDDVPVADDPFLQEAVQIDADMELKTGTTLDAPVVLPGDAETVHPPAGAGPRTAVRGAHNWVPIGPRNVGGRIRAVAIDPSKRQIMYAAPASGGIYKSLDAAESWFPLWHDEPSLSMAAISICASKTDGVWAATGETDDARSNGGAVPTAGVLHSDDGGKTWTQPVAAEAIRGVRIHALAAHPAEEDECWAVGPRGVYRTIDGGMTWTTFANGRAFSDVAFAQLPGGGGPSLFLVPSGPIPVVAGTKTTQHALVMRIDDVATANLAAILPAAPVGVATDPTPHPLLANGSQMPVTGTVNPRDGKIAIHDDTAHGHAHPVVYVAFANAKRQAFGVFRCQDATTANNPTAMTFTLLPSPASFPKESQGEYNLALAVSPANPDHLAFGMVNLYVHRNANGTGNTPRTAAAAKDWLLAQHPDLMIVDGAHHADHHALVFAEVAPDPFLGTNAAGTILLWDANDGGLTVSADWSTGASYVGPPLPAKIPDATLPLAAGAMSWRKRSHGIDATQMYGLTQHPRLPTVLGCGFQDNGAWVGTGGPSWELVQTADGSFVAFDPDDPYRLLATWQHGIAEARFLGRFRDALPLLGDGILEGLWPRTLDDGMHSCDRDTFVTDTAFHPSLPGRVFTARRNRLYATRPTTGDRWEPVPLGSSIEILHQPTVSGAGSSSLEVHDTPGGLALGLLAQRDTVATREDARLVSRVRSLVAQPFTIPDGKILRLTFSDDAAHSAPRQIDVPLTVGGDLPAVASAVQLAGYLHHKINDQLGGGTGVPKVDVLPVIWTRGVNVAPSVFPRIEMVVVVATTTGRASRIKVDGGAADRFRVFKREYTGANAGAGGQALPAMIQLFVPRDVASQPSGAVDLSGRKLVLEREGATHHVEIDFDHDVVAPAVNTKLRAGELADILRAKLPPEHYLVLSGTMRWCIRTSSTAATDVTVGGEFAAGLSLDPAKPGRTVRTDVIRYDLSPTGTPPKARKLQISEAGHKTALTDLTTAFTGLTDLTAVTPVELCDVFRKMIGAVHGAGALRVRCDLDILPGHDLDPMYGKSVEGRITEIAFGPAGSGQVAGQAGARQVWVGDEWGRLFRSLDDGESWEGVMSFPLHERFGAVEAIAVFPDVPANVLAGVFEPGAFDNILRVLYLSPDRGVTWNPVGDGIVDANGLSIGVSAIEIDAAATDNVYVATESGVFHSTDSGLTFNPMNEGLPNAPAVDLALEPSTRMLRVGLWGRGVYERHVGDLPPKDVRLHIRSTALDDGTAQPYSGPDLLAHSPAPLRLDASPDVKQTRRDPHRGLLLDGAEFDDELRHEDVREGPAFVSVQVHNRGAFSTTTTRVAVLWAPADAGPPPLGDGLAAALAAGPLPVNNTFGAWKVLADDVLPDPNNLGHNVVAPGYPRITIVGTSVALAWQAADLAGHARVGLLVLCRCDEDHLAVSTTDVLDLVRTEAKAAYRECDVVQVAEDSRVVLRATGTRGFTVARASPASVRDLADGAAPLGLAPAAAATPEVQFTLAEPYDLSGDKVGGFRVSVDHDVTITLTALEQVVDFQHASAAEVAAILNRELTANGVPVRASTGTFTVSKKHVLFLHRLGAATFSASGTAAARLLGTSFPAGTKDASTDVAAHGGPWDIRPVPAPLELHLVVSTPVELRLGQGTFGLPDPAHATAAEVRAAINRQLDIGGAYSVRAEPRSLRLAVRRSATEAAASKVVSGSYALADLVGSPAQIASADDRLARLRALRAQDVDALTAGQRNFFYVRVANVGTVRGDPARVRVFEVGTTSPFPVDGQAISSVDQVLAVGQSAVVEVPFELGARPSGSRVFVLAVADTAGDALDPPATFDTLDKAHRFCLDNGAAALRELVVA